LKAARTKGEKQQELEVLLNMALVLERLEEFDKSVESLKEAEKLMLAGGKGGSNKKIKEKI
jgi:hypothetical protein